MSAILSSPVILILIIMIVTAYITYHLCYYLTEDIEGSCFSAAAVSIISMMISLEFFL